MVNRAQKLRHNPGMTNNTFNKHIQKLLPIHHFNLNIKYCFIGIKKECQRSTSIRVTFCSSEYHIPKTILEYLLFYTNVQSVDTYFDIVKGYGFC